ncbi:MAG: Fic family protein [Gemmatimonadaceae bacterium]|nr:Fic family protein [Gemmatimonadaceae bacterium]
MWPSDPALDAAPRYRRACEFDAFVPDRIAALDVRLSADVAGLVSDAEQSIQSLNRVDAGVLAPLARLLLRTESIASSKVEGMQMGVGDLARAEVRAEAGERTSATALEIIDNINMMEMAVGEAADGRTVGRAELEAIHARLMARTPNRAIAGRVRDVQNWIGGNDYNPCGADFVPPPPEEVPSLLDDLCNAINDAVLPPLVQAALVHAQFETIHPFADGSGRAGRALIHVVLKRRGLAPRFIPPISVVLAASRSRYIDALTAYRGDDVERWIEHFAAAAARSARLAVAYVDAVRRLQAEWRDRLAQAGPPPRAGAAVWALIDALPAHPVITGPVATTATGLVKTAVYRAIDQLIAAGVLRPLGTARRHRAWEAAGLLQLMEGLEAGEMPDASS